MACNVQRNLLSSEGGQSTEEEPGTVENLGLSFTDIRSFITRSYRDERNTNSTGNIEGQHDIPEIKTMPTVDPECVV